MRHKASHVTVLLAAAGALTIGCYVGDGELSQDSKGLHGDPDAYQGAGDGIEINNLNSPAFFPDGVEMQIRNKRGGSTEVVNVKDASYTTTMEAIFGESEVTDWHTHPGPIIMNVVSGDFVYMADDCVKHTYTAGEALIDGGNIPHTAWNPNDDEETVVVATFLGAPKDGPLTEFLPEEEREALNEECDL